MLQLAFFREQRDRVLTGLTKRNWSKTDAEQLIDNVLKLDDTRRTTQTESDATLAQINQLSKKVGELMKSGQHTEGGVLKQQVSELKEKSKALEAQKAQAEADLETLLLGLPNLPHATVPFGKTADDNEVAFLAQPESELPDLGTSAQPHWELAEKYGVFSLEMGVKLTGAGFPVFRGQGAKLVRALIQFFLDEAHAAGYEEIVPPLVVNEASARGTGQLPDKEAQMYHVGLDDLYLIPTAEVPVTNIFRDVILTDAQLPTKLCAYSQCFRREAGSYGAHVRGLNRVHQFDKVEIVQFVRPENSYAALQDMVEHVKGLMSKLELPYRILKLCGGDMGQASAMTFDFEAWSGAQKKWLEVSSVSNFETYQANRMKARYRDEKGKTQLIHTLNGSALALPRIIASLLENHQTPDGIKIPKALQPYTKFDILK
jgi:seryl-tRNA synthetase